jgi:formate dehydrogenase iron-sulfur subunit
VTTDLLTPIDRYLAVQSGTSAVERFAEQHDADLIPAGARWYSDRLPATPPGPGQQYAFQIDLDQCTGCKSCVAACHSLNGLDTGESWRTVGLLVGRAGESAHTQTVPSGCHHCLEPACLAGCPSNAYEKDPVTGIVRHLDDQCIGCGYCELTCPYEVPTLNHRLGIVRKCDMCAGRLSAGEAPACVQACPTSAITITLVDTDAVAVATRNGELVPGAPASAITRPTTQYVGRRPLPAGAEAADRHALHLSRSHPPLAFMLVMTQLSVGAFVATLGADLIGGGPPASGAIGAAAAAVVALAASLLHVGRPLVAYRALLGLGHSWMSREIAAFGAYAVLAGAYAAVVATGAGSRGLVGAVGGAAALCGVAGVACSALIYVVTARAWWAARYAGTKFALTCAVLGPLLVLSVALLADAGGDRSLGAATVVPLALVAAVAGAAALLDEAWFLRLGDPAAESDLGRTARLLRGRLATATRWRFTLGALGGVAAPLVLAAAWAGGGRGWSIAVLALIGLVAATAGALIERYEFFVASVAPRMPGGFRR